MQRNRAAIIYGLSGQTLEVYPPEHEVIAYGPPTAAASYSVWRGTDTNDQPTMLGGTATLDSMSTTVNTASGVSQADRRKVYLTSTTNVSVGTHYVLANAIGQREIVVPWEVGTSYIKVERELEYDYAITTSTFKGLKQSFTVDSTFVSTLGNINTYGAVYWQPRFIYATTSGGAPPYRVRWSYATGDSITRYYWTTFDLVRASAKHNVTADALMALFPDVADREWREQRGQMFSRQLEAAWDAFVFDLKCCNYPVDQIREDPVVDELIRYKALAIIASAGITPNGRDSETYVRETRDQYDKAFNRAFGSTLKTFIDVGTTGAIHPDPPRTGRLRR